MQFIRTSERRCVGLIRQKGRVELVTVWCRPADCGILPCRLEAACLFAQVLSIALDLSNEWCLSLQGLHQRSPGVSVTQGPHEEAHSTRGVHTDVVKPLVKICLDKDADYALMRTLPQN